MSFKSCGNFLFILMLVACSGGGKKYYDSDKHSNEESSSCGYASGFEAGLDLQQMNKQCRASASKVYVQGYRRALTTALRDNARSCQRDNECNFVSTCWENHCLWSEKSCRSDLECKVRGDCLSDKCVYKK